MYLLFTTDETLTLEAGWKGSRMVNLLREKQQAGKSFIYDTEHVGDVSKN